MSNNLLCRSGFDTFMCFSLSPITCACHLLLSAERNALFFFTSAPAFTLSLPPRSPVLFINKLIYAIASTVKQQKRKKEQHISAQPNELRRKCKQTKPEMIVRNCSHEMPANRMISFHLNILFTVIVTRFGSSNPPSPFVLQSLTAITLFSLQRVFFLHANRPGNRWDRLLCNSLRSLHAVSAIQTPARLFYSCLFDMQLTMSFQVLLETCWRSCIFRNIH